MHRRRSEVGPTWWSQPTLIGGVPRRPRQFRVRPCWRKVAVKVPSNVVADKQRVVGHLSRRQVAKLLRHMTVNF